MKMSLNFSTASLTITFAVTILLQCSPAVADDTIVGAWKAISIETKDLATGRAVQPFGVPPNAMFIFTKGGHFAIVLTARERKPPAGPNPTNAERAELHKSMSAYSGTWRAEGTKLVMTITASHMQSWNGTSRTLTLEFRGNRVTATSAPFKSAIGSGDVVAVNVWERIE
jgi:hypothetical protein